MKEKLLLRKWRCGLATADEKLKTVFTKSPRYQLDEDALGDPMTMFGKDDAPFQGARKRKARLSRAVSNQPAQRPDRLCACEGADFSLEKSQPGRLCGRNPPDFSKIWRRWRGIASPPTSLPKSLFGQAKALRRFASGLQTVEKRRASMRGLGATGIPIVTGGVHGGHGC